MNDNQLVILEWLKDEYLEGAYYPIALVGDVLSELPYELNNAYNSLTRKEEFEILQALAKWGIDGFGGLI